MLNENHRLHKTAIQQIIRNLTKIHRKPKKPLKPSNKTAKTQKYCCIDKRHLRTCRRRYALLTFDNHPSPSNAFATTPPSLSPSRLATPSATCHRRRVGTEKCHNIESNANDPRKGRKTHFLRTPRRVWSRPAARGTAV